MNKTSKQGCITVGCPNPTTLFFEYIGRSCTLPTVMHFCQNCFEDNIHPAVFQLHMKLD